MKRISSSRVSSKTLSLTPMEMPSQTPKARLAKVAKLLKVRRQVGLEAAAEWYSSMLRGFEALAFLERSRDMAAEPVLASVPVLARPTPPRSR